MKREVLVLVDALYLELSAHNKLDTSTVKEAYVVVAGRLGLVKLNREWKTITRERLTDLNSGKVVLAVGGAKESGETVEPAKKRGRIDRDVALPIVGTNPSFLKWKDLNDGDEMAYGSRWYAKGVHDMEEKLLSHIFHTLKSNKKRTPKGGAVAAKQQGRSGRNKRGGNGGGWVAAKQGGKKRRRMTATSSSLVVGGGVAAKQGRSGQKRGGGASKGSSLTAATKSKETPASPASCRVLRSGGGTASSASSPVPPQAVTAASSLLTAAAKTKETAASPASCRVLRSGGRTASSASSPVPPQAWPRIKFDEAINYVTTIKRRFASNPEIYHKFLAMLEAFEKKQRGIKEVLDEVSLLFADHADLLEEFTNFLRAADFAVVKTKNKETKESDLYFPEDWSFHSPLGACAPIFAAPAHTQQTPRKLPPQDYSHMGIFYPPAHQPSAESEYYESDDSTNESAFSLKGNHSHSKSTSERIKTRGQARKEEK